MGNYNGTVRCGVCYQRGHNKRTCPRHTERMVSQMERWVRQAEAPGCGSSQRERYMDAAREQAEKIGKRTGTNPMTKTTVTNRGPERRCSYCKYKHGAYGDEGRGHTRRTCQTLKDDLVEAVKINARFRAGILESLRDAGAGVGTLMSIHMSGYFPTPEGEEEWDRRACAIMLQRIKWDAINYTSQHEEYLLGQRMDKMGTSDGCSAITGPYRYTEDDAGQRTALRFSAEAGWGPAGSHVGSWEPGTPDEPERVRTYVLSQVPSETINPPPGWLTGDSPVVIEHFKGLKR